MSKAKLRKRYKRQLEERDASFIRQRHLNQPNKSVLTLFFRKTQIMLLLLFVVLFFTSLVFIYDDSPLPIYSDQKITEILNAEHVKKQDLLLPLPSSTKMISSTIENRYHRGSLSERVPHNYYLATWNGYHFLFYMNGDHDRSKIKKYLMSYGRFPVSWHKIGKAESEIFKKAKTLYPDLPIVSTGMFSVIEQSHYPTDWIVISLLFFYMFCKTLYGQIRVFKTYKRLYPDSI